MENNTLANRWKKPFFTFWVSQAFSLFGSSLVQFALVWWLTRTTGSASVLATASAMAVLPEILVSPFAGAIIDRSNRKRVMILADGMIALATVILAVVFFFGAVQIWQVYLLMLVRSIGGAFHYPAEQASISLMVPEKHLSRIAGLNQALYGGINIIAPPAGALLLELLDVQGTLAVDVITAFIAISILLFIHIPQPAAKDEKEPISFSSLFADLKGGLRYILDWKGLVALIGIAMAFKLALSPAFSLLPLLVSKHFNGDAAQYALVESISGIGVVAGGLILGVWGGFKKRIWTMWASLLSIGLSLLWVSTMRPDQFSLFLPAMFLFGFMVPFIDGPFIAIIQANVNPDYQGRVLTMTTSLLWLTTPIGLGIAGPVADTFGIPVWYALAGGLCLVGMLVGSLLPQVRNIEEDKANFAAEASTSVE
ncbi:MAG: transporter, family, macrolide efflux protein [Chloroflexota bacterium]|nr:transporter, family, macrolide efflux protein [Chloroflexota bacterium]